MLQHLMIKLLIEQIVFFFILILVCFYLIKQGLNGVFKHRFFRPLQYYPIELWFEKDPKERIRFLKKLSEVKGTNAFFWGILYLFTGIILLIIIISYIFRFLDIN